MKRPLFPLLTAGTLLLTAASPAPPDDGKLRIIVFGAHPDDCEIQVGGVAALWAAKGHHVKLVSVTNGDIGHWREAGGPWPTAAKPRPSAPTLSWASLPRSSTSTTAS